MNPQLTDDQIAGKLQQLQGWERHGNHIRRTITCRTFPAALALVVEIGFLAEAAQHHPDIDIRWRRVTLALTTHDAGGLTAKDIDLARQIDQLVK